jgi:hypothetical protein
MIPLIAGTCAGRVEIVSRSDSDSSAFRMAALLDIVNGIPDAHDRKPSVSRSTRFL